MLFNGEEESRWFRLPVGGRWGDVLHERGDEIIGEVALAGHGLLVLEEQGDSRNDGGGALD